MRKFFIKLASLNRTTIYLIITIGVLLPLVVPLNLGQKMSPPTERLYTFIDTLPRGSHILISADYDPSALPELQPMLEAMVKHAVLRGVIPVIISLYPQGTGLGIQACEKARLELGARPDTDYVILGYKPGLSAVILGIGEDIRKVFPTNYKGIPLDSIPAIKNVKNYDDIALVVSLSAGSVPLSWVTYAYTRYNQKIATGVTAVSAADFYPYLQTGQFIGALMGMKGAAEYEYQVNKLLEKAGYKKAKSVFAVRGMEANSIAHLLIMLFIIVGNIGYFLTKKRREA